MHKTQSQKAQAAERKSAKGSKKTRKGRKFGRNKIKCQKYLLENRRDKNKRRRIEKDNKRKNLKSV